jgi:hypothetical protein
LCSFLQSLFTFALFSLAGVLNLVLASTTVPFSHQVVLLDIFLNCGGSSTYFMTALAGEKWNYCSSRRWKKVGTPGVL